MLPTVNTTITVTTEWNMPNYWGDVQHNEYTGKVLTSPKWLTPQEFAIENPDHPNGFSVINMNHVVDIRDADGKEYKFTTDSSVRVWAVTGSKGNKYNVKLQDGNYSCDCVGFQYRKHCRHITECTSDLK